MDERREARPDEVLRTEAGPAGARPEQAGAGLESDTVTTTVLPVADGAAGRAVDVVPEPAASAAAFPVVLRGYDRGRVDAVVADLRSRLDRATAGQEAAEGELAAARAAVGEARAAAERARREGEQARDERDGRLAPAALAERIQRILTLAEEEAADQRAAARRDADAMLAQARAAVDALEQRRAELDRELAGLHQKIAALLHREAPG